MTYNSNSRYFHSIICIGTCRLQNIGHVVSASLCQSRWFYGDETLNKNIRRKNWISINITYLYILAINVRKFSPIYTKSGALTRKPFLASPGLLRLAWWSWGSHYGSQHTIKGFHKKKLYKTNVKLWSIRLYLLFIPRKSIVVVEARRLIFVFMIIYDASYCYPITGCKFYELYGFFGYHRESAGVFHCT